MPPTLAYIDQWTAETEIEPLAPFRNVANLIMAYNKQRNDLFIGGPSKGVGAWPEIQTALLKAIGAVEAAASVASTPISKRWPAGVARA